MNNNIDMLVLKLANEQIISYKKVRDEVITLEAQKYNKHINTNGYTPQTTFFYSAIGEKRKEYKLKNELERNSDFLDYIGWDWREC